MCDMSVGNSRMGDMSIVLNQGLYDKLVVSVG